MSCFESNEGSQSLKIYYMSKFFEDYSRGFLVSKMFGEGILTSHKRTLEKGSWNQRLWVLQQFNMLQLSASDDPFAKTILILLVHNWEVYLVLPYIEVMNDLDTSFLLSTEQCQNQSLTLHSKYIWWEVSILLSTS